MVFVYKYIMRDGEIDSGHKIGARLRTEMKISRAIINIWNGKVYMPAIGRTDSGMFMGTRPILVCDLSEEEITGNLERIRKIGHPLLHINSAEDRKKHADLILKLTNVRSWKELARTGYCYVITWDEKETGIEMSRLDKQGRWEYDPVKTRILPLDTPLKEVIQIILDDYYSRRR
jgi:hypothetical protein